MSSSLATTECNTSTYLEFTILYELICLFANDFGITHHRSKLIFKEFEALADDLKVTMSAYDQLTTLPLFMCSSVCILTQRGHIGSKHSKFLQKLVIFYYGWKAQLNFG